MELMEAIRRRQSCRAYTDEPLSEEQITVLLQAAHAAPVARGQFETVQISVVESPELIAKIEATAARVQPGFPEHAAYQAPLLICLLSSADEKAAPQDLACVAQNITLAATDLGLGSVYIMGIPNVIEGEHELIAELGAPENYRLLVMVAVGHRAQPEKDRELVLDKFVTHRL